MIILEELVKANILKEEQIPEVLKIANEKYAGNIDDALLDLKIDENQILKIKEIFFNIPSKDVDPRTVRSELFKLVPIDAVKMYRFLPIGFTDSILEIGIVDPENTQAVDAITFITAKLNKPFKIFVIKNSTYQNLLEGYDGMDNQVGEALSELDAEMDNNQDSGVTIESIKKASDTLKPGEEEKIVEDAPIIKIVAVILRHATEGLASDIHIENVGDKVKVRFRVDGVLHTSLELPINVYNGVVARIKILAKLRLDEKRKPQDGGISAKINGRKIDFRVSTMPSYYGEKIVMRILDSEKGIQKLDNLNMSPENMALVHEALVKP